MRKKIFDFIFNFIFKLNIKPPCFQHFNNKKVENLGSFKKSNIITHRSKIYDNLYINK